MAIVVAVVAAVVAPGCGGAPDAGTTNPRRIEVEDAGQHDGELVVVEGFLVAAPEAPHRLCSELAESYPPQCGGARLELVGLDRTRVAGTSANDELPEGERTLWTEEPIALTGRIDGERLTVPGGDRVIGAVVVVEALAAPTCPVATEPPDPACAPRSLPAADIELWGAGGSVRPATTDTVGVAAFDVAAGTYQVVPLPVAGLTPPERTEVVLGTGTVRVTVTYDTGIR